MIINNNTWNKFCWCFDIVGLASGRMPHLAFNTPHAMQSVTKRFLSYIFWSIHCVDAVEKMLTVCMHTRSSSSSSSSYPFNGPFSGTTKVSQYQKGKTNLDFTEARDSEWRWHQLGHMQVCTLLQTDKPHQHPTTQFSTGWMHFMPPNQQRQSTEGHVHKIYNRYINRHTTERDEV